MKRFTLLLTVLALFSSVALTACGGGGEGGGGEASPTPSATTSP